MPKSYKFFAPLLLLATLVTDYIVSTRAEGLKKRKVVLGEAGEP